MTRSILLAVLLPGAFLPGALPVGAIQTGTPPSADGSARARDTAESTLWGRVTLADGEIVEGFLRWDRNETSPHDVLDGDRDPTEEGLRLRRAFSEASSEDRRRSIELPGLRVTWEEDEEVETRVRSGVRFGWITRIVPDGPDAMVELRDGSSVRFRPSSTDIGPTFRGLEVEPRPGDVRTFEWARIAEVRLLPAPEGLGPGRTRLHGTVETVDGLRFTGWVAWDADEVFESDVLEGADATVRFGDIVSIARAPRGVAVVLASGAAVTLAGTDEVDDRNRRIHVSDPALGGVVVGWGGLSSLRFHPSGAGAPVFDAGGPLSGTVETESGELLQGRVVWDLDETEGWQFLNGSTGDVEMDVEFSRIRRIEKARGGSGVVVILRDGRAFEMEGSNDVDETNRGIVVIDTAGRERLVDWAGFRALDLGGR